MSRDFKIRNNKIIRYIGKGGNIIIPKGVYCIEENAFKDCEEVTSITIPNGVTKIGRWAFSGCSELKNIVIPNTIKRIGPFAFNRCYNLKYNICKNGEYLGNEENLYHVLVNVIDKDVIDFEINTQTKIIGHDSFEDCKIESLTIPNGVKNIEFSAFYNCERLKDIIIPNSVTHIGNCAFNYCEMLKSITIPNSVASLKNGIFDNCGALETIKVASDNKKYADYDANCIVDKGTNTLIVGCKNTIIPNNVTHIADSAFCGCIDLTDIIIPNSVTSIGNWVFEDCKNLRYNMYDNGLYLGNSQNLHLIFMKMFKDKKSCQINPNTKIIACESFEDCENLETIIIPIGVTSIDNWAFYDCCELTSITIPTTVTSIGEKAFYYCEKLKTVYYQGDENDRLKILIKFGNEDLMRATWVYGAKIELE